LTAISVVTSGEKSQLRIMKKLKERLLRDWVDIIVLGRLKNGGCSGYDLILFIQERFGFLVSSGTVYSLLYSLERNGLVVGKWVERHRAYILTEKGAAQLLAVCASKAQLVVLLGEVFQSNSLAESALGS
jgi:DNA-binding PadR family transcriptional regulator